MLWSRSVYFGQEQQFLSSNISVRSYHDSMLTIFSLVLRYSIELVSSAHSYLNVLNPLKIARHYELNLCYADERRLIKILLVSYSLLHDQTLECSPSIFELNRCCFDLGKLTTGTRVEQTVNCHSDVREARMYQIGWPKRVFLCAPRTGYLCCMRKIA